VLLAPVLLAAGVLATGVLGLAAGPADAVTGTAGTMGTAGTVDTAGTVSTAGTVDTADTAGTAGAARVGVPAGGRGACWSGSHPQLAARLSAQIAAVLDRRASAVGLAVSDPATGVTCELAASRQFDSASIVKATILAALLHGDDARPSASERATATAMITESDNDAATELWNDVGPVAMRQFLNLAKMTQTVPGTGGYWGLTQVTAGDQMKLLHLLTTANGVLSAAARSYELGLMARVDPGQRWGISAGVPASMTVELKNGWLPVGAAGWHINSIGCVSPKAARGAGAPAYCLAVLTEDNPTMAYGVQTVSEVARVVNGELGSPLATASLAVPANADALTTAGLTAAQVRSAGLGPMGLRAPAPLAPPAAPTRPGLMGRLWTAIAAAVIAVALLVMALLAAGARLRAKRARRLAGPAE
jgi:hypothetical protein